MATCGDVTGGSKDTDIASSLQLVMDNVQNYCNGGPVPRIVAVSKTKSVEDILKAYEAGQHHFGENYVPELRQKASDARLVSLNIKWHFIGHLQSNKCNMLCAVPNLYMVECVDSEHLATKLDGCVKRLELLGPLRVMVQVNTSGEDNKSGYHPDTCVQLVNHVIAKCPNLQLCGLMTIGRLGHDYAVGPNPDFECLLRCRSVISKETGRNDLELSMGMSADYVEAIKAGSTSVRVGTSIFGARNPVKK